jgi:hypothetical protein
MLRSTGLDRRSSGPCTERRIRITGYRGEDEVLAEPIYGCWEANMAHALERTPIDVCRHRGEAEVVIGNAGVVRILQVGEAVKTVNPGDLCIVFCNGIWDRFGYPEKILADDAPQTIGVLAKRIKLHSRQVIAIPLLLSPTSDHLDTAPVSAGVLLPHLSSAGRTKGISAKCAPMIKAAVMAAFIIGNIGCGGRI